MIDQSTQTHSGLRAVCLDIAKHTGSTPIKKNFRDLLGNKLVMLFAAFLLITTFNSYGQYNLAVSFNEGFVGDNAANNKSTTASYLTTKGWSLAQFTQNSTASIFTAQGNDIIGNVVLKDALGVVHTIPGFVK